MADVELNQWFFSGDVVLSYLALAGATCTVYDYITTLDIEIEVNRPKWKMPQGLFFLNRYAGLGWHVYNAFCSTFNLINVCFTFVTFVAMHGIMVYRVSSMYTHDRTILRILVIGFCVEFISFTIIQVALWYYGRTATDSDILLQYPIGFCGREKFPPWVSIVWLPLVLFDCLIFTLAVILCVRCYKEAGSHEMFPNLPNSSRTAPLLFILLRDSIVFPFIFCLSCIINLVVFFLLTTGLRHTTIHITFLLPVILSGLFGSRLILNLRESCSEPYEQEFNFRIDTHTIPDSIELDGGISMPCPNPMSTILPTMDN
ncbi:hypothetical protein BDN70DRAFT_937763 [Pholiota conissans]|uniref:DUF6533 domain-containing protein n=1 Tax=Pholiota conissans TaxID=109636 RepID=A0A9P6CTF8_9AGAR|nr:hypothetical protein BDN70DRAFT_937763 [Pholiota conissans]